MLYHFFIAFFSLILISAVFGTYRKLKDSKNVFIHALSYVPITCSSMTVACVLGWLVSAAFIEFTEKNFFEFPLYKDSLNYIVIFCLFAVPIIVFIGGVFLLRYFARKNPRKHIYTAYVSVFIASGIFGVSLCLYGLFFPPWQKVQVGDYFSYETQAMPRNAGEYNLRLRFNSGKIINLIRSLNDNATYTLYKFDNGDIFIKAKNIYMPHYIVSPEKEEAYLFKDGYKYKLNGKAIYDTQSHGSEKIDLPKDTMFFSTYECFIFHNPSYFKAKGIETQIPNTLPCLGTLNTKSFNKTLSTNMETQPQNTSNKTLITEEKQGKEETQSKIEKSFYIFLAIIFLAYIITKWREKKLSNDENSKTQKQPK